MELIKNFGLDPVYLAAQIVNFLIILYFLRRFLYKPVFKMLKKRENEIKEGLEKTEEAKRLMEKSLAEEKNILKKAQTQATKIIEDAKAEVTQLQKNTEENTRKQAEKILIEAKEQIAKETKEAEAKLTTQVNKIAVVFLQKSLSDLFSEKDQKEIMTKAIKKLKEKPN